MKRAKTSMDGGRIDQLALTPEAREQQLIEKAERLVERRLEDGSASAQEVCHFLKLASMRERTERQILEKKVELLTAQTEALKSAANMESLYKDAMSMFKKYSGVEDEDYE